MKRYGALVLLIMIMCSQIFAQRGIAVNNTGLPADSSAILDVASNSQGILIPRMTLLERNAILNPANGLLIFNTDCQNFNVFTTSGWMPVNTGTGSIPQTPDSITGTSTICQSGQSGVSYSVPPITGATTYLWAYSGSGFSISSGQGTNSITADFSSAVTSGSLIVTAVADCGTSLPSPGLNVTVTSCFICGSILTDSRDGRSYASVQIGSQCWMAENLNYSTSGTFIPSSSDQTDNGIIEKYCYGNDTNNCFVYGGLYQWAEMVQYFNGATNSSTWSVPPAGNLQGICPTGWHLPTDAEWCQMENYIEPGTDPGCNLSSGRGVNTGGMLKEAGLVHWASPNTGATNSTGFTALPSGVRITDGNTYNMTVNGYIWTASDGGATQAWDRNLPNTTAEIYRDNTTKAFGFPVRCIQD